MTQTKTPTPTRLSAALLLAAAATLLAGFIVHPDESVDAATTAATIATHAQQWSTAHWLLAAGGVMLAVAAFAQFRAAATPGLRRAWLAMAVSAVLALEIFVLEATVAVQRGSANDAAGLEALLLPELPGILGLFGLNAAGAALFFLLGRRASRGRARVACMVAAGLSAVGFAGNVAFGLGNQALAMLQYATAGYILALGILGAVLLRRPAVVPSPTAMARMG